MKTQSASRRVMRGALWCMAAVAALLNGPVHAQTITDGPPPLTGLTFSSPFINVGGSPQNIFVTPQPSGASLANCVVSGPAELLARYNPQGFFGPTISVASGATGVTQAVAHTLTCGTVAKSFVVKPPTYPAEITLSRSELVAGSADKTSLTVSHSPADTVLPTCSVSGDTVLATVAGNTVTLTSAAAAITSAVRQTISCGSLSQTFTVAPSTLLKPVFAATAGGPLTARTLSATLTPATADVGKAGAVYVAAIISGVVFFMDSNGSWSPYTGASPPAAATGPIKATPLVILPTATDVTALTGGQIVIGYGLGTAPASDPFNNMLNNARYDVVHTFK